VNERMNDSSYVRSKPKISAQSSYTEDNCALKEYYAAFSGDSLKTFRYNP
jgi:hypothetical protein